MWRGARPARVNRTAIALGGKVGVQWAKVNKRKEKEELSLGLANGRCSGPIPPLSEREVRNCRCASAGRAIEAARTSRLGKARQRSAHPCRAALLIDDGKTARMVSTRYEARYHRPHHLATRNACRQSAEQRVGCTSPGASAASELREERH